MTPKILHLFWNNSPLSYLQYLTPGSFHKYHPEWKIKMYVPKEINPNPSWYTPEQKIGYTGKNWVTDLWTLPYVEKVEFTLNDLGLNVNINDILKSDLLRLKVLHDDGGVYADMDVLFINSIPDSVLNSGAGIVYDGHHFLIGFLTSSKGHWIYKELYDRAKEGLDTNSYQSVGSHLFKRLFNSYDNLKSRDVMNIPLHMVYPYQDHNIPQFFTTSNNLISPETFAIHWYNGHPIAKEYQNKYDSKVMENLVVNNTLKDLNGSI